MPDLYKPPQPHRAQAVRSARGGPRPYLRWWWPVVGLLPLLTVAVLASRGVFSPGQPAPPVASAPVATATLAAVAQAPTSGSQTTQAAPTPAATPATSTASGGASPTPASTSTQSSTAAATSSTTPAGATATTSGPFVAYRVQPGDTVRFIAHAYGVSAASIVQASGLTNPDLVRVGQVLTIPDQPGWLYRMQPGETLDQVAARTGVETDRIAAASGLTIASVGTGSVILIPDQSQAVDK